jgi:hypothetical protein
MLRPQDLGEISADMVEWRSHTEVQMDTTRAILRSNTPRRYAVGSDLASTAGRVPCLQDKS